MKSYRDILGDLKKKIYRPVYFLMGKESYYIDLITKYFVEEVLEEHERDFNQTIYYGKDTELKTVVEAAKRFPMMANNQVVILKEAQHIKKWDELAQYVQNPQEATILVICYKYGTPNKRLKAVKDMLKTMQTKGVVFESKEVKTYEMPDWINNYLKTRKFSADQKVSMMLSEYLGNDLSKVTNELDKLMVVLPEGARITPADVEENIGISKDYNVFELTRALGKKDALTSMQILKYMGKNPKQHPIQMSMPILFTYFRNMLLFKYLPPQEQGNENLASSKLGVPFFVAREYKSAARNYSGHKLVEIISILREYDLKSKGVGANALPPEELHTELGFRLLH